MIENEAIALNELITYMMKHVGMFQSRGHGRREPRCRWNATPTKPRTRLHPYLGISERYQENTPLQWVRITSTGKPPLPIIDRILGILIFREELVPREKQQPKQPLEEGSSTIRRKYYIGIVKKFILQNVERVLL